MGKRWTDQDIDELKRMAEQYPAPKIAEIMDRSVGGVTFKAHQLKLSLRASRDSTPKPSLRNAAPRLDC
jgi:hypothetical protein